MTNTDTVERLRELRAKATLGKWKPHKDYPECIIAPDDANNWAIARCDDDAGFNSHGDDVSDQSNAALIVEAINALPALLDAVEALEPFAREAERLPWNAEDAATYEAGCDEDCDPIPSLFVVRDLRRARAALATLKGEG